MNRVHEFASCQKLVRVGEAIAVAALGSLPTWHIERRSESREEQVLMGCDYLVRHGIHRGGLEVKTDMRGFDTGNLAIEMEHKLPDGRTEEGWAFTTTAKFLAFVIAPRDAIEKVSERCQEAVARFEGSRLLVMGVDAMRDVLPAWRERYGQRSAQNSSGRVTWNLIVPIRVARQEPPTIATYDIWFRLEGQAGRVIAGASELPKQRTIA